MNIAKILAPAFLLASIALSACEQASEPYNELTNSKEGAFVYIGQVKSSVNELTLLPFTNEERTFTFSATFGSLGYPKNDIPVKFIINDRAFDSVNTVRQAEGFPLYEKFPADAYTLSGTEATIPAGELTSNMLTLKYIASKFDPKKQYLMPITLQQAGGYAVTREKSTAFVVARIAEKRANTAGWIATASSEQTYWENTGLASAVLDGDPETYWHSQWAPESPEFPHWLQFDMKTVRTVTKIAMFPRMWDERGFTKFKIEGSLDGATWITLGNNLTFDPTKNEDGDAAQEYPITPTEIRFLKLTMLEGKMGATNLSEFIVYQF
ncbi:discoidin domain-containing protein [Solitalea sp. MAHUQ-68]|uniref:Discoidin domain-containing protein n=1 Tax=Solitalea agri TaxID=2953739 RepID=A0A9X2F5R0_9SPHI|nr:discoidin domain-containing protein [Solitalea agri]MCO4294735.1 discoidin domain-containing protein [Solitalea agri]